MTRTPDGEVRARRSRLPETLAELASRWRLDLGPELPGGLLSCVREATLHDGTGAVLKVGRSPRTHDEITALRAWGGRGAPALLAADEQLRAFDEHNILVCERRGLCAVDPLPCAGDPAYDAGYWVHGERRPGRRARLDAIVAATRLERARVRDWAAVVGVHG